MPDPEIEAIGKVADALGDLDEETRARVLRWASDRYGVQTFPIVRPGSKGDERNEVNFDSDDNRGEKGTSDGGSGGMQKFEHFAEFYDAVDPSTDSERVMVAAYWTQELIGKSPFGSQELNKALKDLGHGVAEINKAMSRNMEKKPALILQVSRGGTSKQARKQYKLTEAGLKWVKGRLS